MPFGTPASDTVSMDEDSESEESSDGETHRADDDWSGVDHCVESAIVHAVFPDLELAAYLITRLYGMLYACSSKKISIKVSHWREHITSCPKDSGTTSTERGPPSNVTSNTTIQDQSKRHGSSASGGSNPDEEGEGEDDDADDSRRKRHKENSSLGAGPIMPLQRFACPFFKMNPSKYCIQKGAADDRQYRICAGPGFKSIQLLKYFCIICLAPNRLANDIREHLRRKHYPVQCNRCCLIFKVIKEDRATAITELKKHQRRDEVCQKSPESEIEGLSDDHWLKLDQTRQGKKGKLSSAELPKSEVDKWMDIWKILFPEISPPATPCKKSRWLTP